MFVLSVLMLCALLTPPVAAAYSCNNILQDVEIKNIDWTNLEQCLAEVDSESLSKNTSLNIWRLIKNAFDGLENIPPQVYVKLGYALTAIPLEELRNISLEQVEVVEAFGAVRRHPNVAQGFSAAQSALLAKKMRTEWLGKNPDTYSEYDLISMGELVCHLNVSDIEAMHAVAFKEAAVWLGNIDSCPQDRLQAFAKLAVRSDAFGEAKIWSKLDVNIIGNIINGLSQADIAQIDRDKLHLNQYYTQPNTKNYAGVGSNKRRKQLSTATAATVAHNYNDNNKNNESSADDANSLQNKHPSYETQNKQ